MRSNKDIRYNPKIGDVIYVAKDIKAHIGRSIMIPKNTPCKVVWTNYDTVELLVLAGITAGKKYTIRGNNTRKEQGIFPFTGKAAKLLYE